MNRKTIEHLLNNETVIVKGKGNSMRNKGYRTEYIL